MNTKPVQIDIHSNPRQTQHRSDQQPRNGVWQDNPTPRRDRTATKQPAAHKKPMRPQPMRTAKERVQNKTVHKRKTVSLTLWVKPIVKRELQRVAAAEELSISVTGATLLEKALQNHLDGEHAGLIKPVIEKAIKKEMRSYSTRLAILLVRVAFASEQTRSLVTNILGRQSSVTPDVLNTILDSSSKAAKGKITYKSPQLESIIAEVETWFTQRENSD